MIGKPGVPQSSVLVVCGDPGGGNAVAPVVEALRREGIVTVEARAYKQTQNVWSRRSLAFEPLDEAMNVKQAVALIGKYGIQLVLTGTSVNSVDLEKNFILAARQSGVPSLALLDFWSNYRLRFSDASGYLACLPDRIAIMDQRAHQEMIREGFKKESLVITGQPALEDLGKWQNRFSPEKKAEIRKELNLKQADVMVLFASQPLSEIGPADEQDPNYRGYTENTVLPLLCAALKRIGDSLQRRIVLIIQRHYREDPAKFESLELKGVSWKVAVPEEPYDLALVADVVSGMNSIFLLEAASLGCLTVSLQPGLRVRDKLPSNLNGMTIPVYHQEEIEPVLERLIVNGRTAEGRSCGLSGVKGSTQRVVSLIYEMVGLGEEEAEKRIR